MNTKIYLSLVLFMTSVFVWAQSDMAKNTFAKPRPALRITQTQIDAMSFADAKTAVSVALLDLSKEYSVLARDLLANLEFFRFRWQIGAMDVQRIINSFPERKHFLLKDITFKLFQILDQNFDQNIEGLQFLRTRETAQITKLVNESSVIKSLAEKEIPDLSLKVESLEARVTEASKDLTEKMSQINAMASVVQNEDRFFNLDRLFRFETLVMFILQSIIIYLVFIKK